ncbi:MAG: DUF1206 domain-containing protein [Cyanobacteria bacterium J06614_10]
MAHLERHDEPVEKWIAYYARFGYGAKGVLYGSTGILALFEALDISGGDAVGSTGALKKIASQPLGRTVAIVIALSLIGYVVWRFIQAGWDPEHRGCRATDIVRRIGYGSSGLMYASIAYSVVEVLTGTDSDGGKAAEEWAFAVMTVRFGRCLVGAGGLLFFGIGCYYFYRAIRAEFRKRFKLHKMSDVAKTWATVAGRVGIAARGVVYIVIGASGIQAAWAFDPDLIKTSEDVMAIFDENPSDELILGILGIGFVAYAVHMGFQAVYRNIDPM